jgi:hypothetical protein
MRARQRISLSTFSDAQGQGQLGMNNQQQKERNSKQVNNNNKMKFSFFVLGPAAGTTDEPTDRMTGSPPKVDQLDQEGQLRATKRNEQTRRKQGTSLLSSRNNKPQAWQQRHRHGKQWHGVASFDQESNRATSERSRAQQATRAGTKQPSGTIRTRKINSKSSQVGPAQQWLMGRQHGSKTKSEMRRCRGATPIGGATINTISPSGANDKNMQA